MSAILSQLKRNTKLQLNCPQCKKLALRILYGSIFLLLHLRLQGRAVLGGSGIVEIKMVCGFAICDNIWANAESSIVVVVLVVNSHMNKKMIVGVRVCVCVCVCVCVRARACMNIAGSIISLCF
jgi:hypothetical protein